MADPDSTIIEREIAGKLPIMKKGGGYIYHSDHSIPDNVSLEQYRRVMDLVARYGSYAPSRAI
jgi:uroporphyrinogen decarboxylase